MSSFGLTLARLFTLAAAVHAAPARFKFAKGETLTYTILQTTRATETLIDEKTGKPAETVLQTKHTVVRRWKVTDLDDKGIATLEMSIASMKWEQKLPNGESEVFDS